MARTLGLESEDFKFHRYIFSSIMGDSLTLTCPLLFHQLKGNQMRVRYVYVFYYVQMHIILSSSSDSTNLLFWTENEPSAK